MAYENNFSAVRKYVLSNNGNEQQAEDLYHDAFIAAWRNVQLGKFESRGEGSFRSYILTIAKNKWIDGLRAIRNKQTVHIKPGDLKAADDPESSEEDRLIDLIKLQFNNMGTHCRDLLIEFYYKKQSMREISEARGWTEHTARNNKYRCIQKLRELINQYIP